MQANRRRGSVMRLCIFKLMICLCQLFISINGQQHDLTYRIREEQELGTYVGNVAKDSLIYTQFNQIEFQKLQYSIPPTTSKFTIDSKTSTIRTAQVIDREKECDRGLPDEPCAISFDVSVYRVNGDGSFNLLRIIKIKVLIDDINDNAPVFPSNQTTIDVLENLEVNQVLRTSAAIDMDTGANNTVQTYALEGGMDIFGLQVIQNSAGLSPDLGIVLKKSLDRETQSYYKLKVIAEDGGFPKLTGSVDIFIKVIDVNDNVPHFRKTAFDMVVPEDIPIGTTVLTVLADDPDEGENGRLTYSFSSLTSSKVTDYLAIGETNGDIYLVKHLDYERDKSFRFAVTVSDNGNPAKSSQTSVQIVVQDVNDNAPKIDVTLPSPYVKESIGVGNYIAHVSLSDSDSSQNSQITCSIANERFMLQKFSNSDSIYTVILRSHLDYEKSRTELVNVTCHDGGQPPLYNSSAFIIYVQDVNDNAPVFTKSRYQINIDEDNHIGQFVTQVQAVDPDEDANGNVTYSLSKNSDKKFQINPLSGVIKAMQVLDHEEKTSYELEVVAKDQGSIPTSSSVTVTILVGDLNDNPPQFIKLYFEMSVQENKPKHTTCGSVVARDPDTGIENHLRFQFTKNFSYSDIFGIDRVSGSIYTMTPLDREFKDVYYFEVMVFDESQPSFYDVSRVTMLVGDDNDNKPNVTFPSESNNTFQFMFTQPPGSFLFTVECHDLDAGENGTFRFAIIGGNDKGLFFINAVSGELIVAKRMNIFDTASYRIIILVRDGGLDYLESIRDINIIITVANGTTSYLQEEESRANIAIVIALICITSIMAMSVLITICIIRRIDRERKQHTHAKSEEENIYKQQVVPDTPMTSPSKGSYENEIEKLKRKIRRDMSFGEEDDIGHIDTCDQTTKSSFTTFRTTSSGTDQKNLSSTMSPSDMDKRIHYADKGLEIDRLTAASSSPSRTQPTSSTFQSGRGSQWSGGRAQSSRSSVIKFSVEDTTSHTSGSTSDSGRGGSSEEGDGHGHKHAVVVAIGDTDRARATTNSYTTPAHLITFGSPKSLESLTSASHQPRSLSTSINSETARKRLWGDTPTTSISGMTLSTRLSSDSPLHVFGISETSTSYKPNISFSDDSVTANATVGNTQNATNTDNRNMGCNRAGIPSDVSPDQSSMSSQLNISEIFAEAKHLSPKTTRHFASTHQQKTSPIPNFSDNSYTGLAANISRIPNVDSSARHGMFVEGVSLSDHTGSSRSKSYAHANRVSENGSSNRNNVLSNAATNSSRNNLPLITKNRSQSGGLHLISPRKPDNETESTYVGEEYSFNDMKDVLDQASATGTQQEDDNTTTTSGSYTINADDLRQEIDQLFFNDIVV